MRETRRARKSLPNPAGIGLWPVQACGLYETLSAPSKALKGFPLAVEQGCTLADRCLFIGQCDPLTWLLGDLDPKSLFPIWPWSSQHPTPVDLFPPL